MKDVKKWARLGILSERIAAGKFTKKEVKEALALEKELRPATMPMEPRPLSENPEWAPIIEKLQSLVVLCEKRLAKGKK